MKGWDSGMKSKVLQLTGAGFASLALNVWFQRSYPCLLMAAIRGSQRPGPENTGWFYRKQTLGLLLADSLSLSSLSLSLSLSTYLHTCRHACIQMAECLYVWKNVAMAHVHTHIYRPYIYTHVICFFACICEGPGHLVVKIFESY